MRKQYNEKQQFILDTIEKLENKNLTQEQRFKLIDDLLLNLNKIKEEK